MVVVLTACGGGATNQSDAGPTRRDVGSISDCEETPGQPAHAACCPALGRIACVDDYFCGGVGGASPPTCLPPAALLRDDECSFDEQCASGICSPETLLCFQPAYLRAEVGITCEEATTNGGTCSPATQLFEEFDGSDNSTVQCNVSLVDGMRSVSVQGMRMNVTSGRFGLRVEGARYGTSWEAVASPDCRVTITDGSNEYSGACGPLDPSVDQPCQLFRLDVHQDPSLNVVVDGLVLCQHLAPVGDSSIAARREFAWPGAPDAPFIFQLMYCRGI